jgi:RNA polymerase sigma-54 factor
MSASGPRLSLAPRQSVVITPQLQQAIRLLQMSRLELEGVVQHELEHNPLLGEAEPPAPEAEAAEATRTVAADAGETAGDEPAEGARWEDPPLRAPAGTLAGGGAAPETGEEFDPVALQAARPTLREHLRAQFAGLDLDPAETLIAEYLTGMLDEAGYLAAPLAEIAAELGCPEQRAAAVLTKLQGLEPAGLFARDLAECLRLQLAARDALEPRMAALLDNLELIGAGDIDALARRLDCDTESVRGLLARLRRLDPKPALALDTAPPPAVLPDLEIRRTREGWRVELTPEGLPRVMADRAYYAELKRAARGAEAQRFIVEKYQAASWFARALAQRAETILKVATEIMRHQHGFLDDGVSALRPLVLREVAETVGLHESTVSRATAGKYIATPRGTYELRFFFSSGVGAGAAAQSSIAIRHRIKTLIDQETPKQVYSDDRIVSLLRAEGVDIARRTVAKYREAMDIPSSVERRRMKRAGL